MFRLGLRDVYLLALVVLNVEMEIICTAYEAQQNQISTPADLSPQCTDELTDGKQTGPHGVFEIFRSCSSVDDWPCLGGSGTVR